MEQGPATSDRWERKKLHYQKAEVVEGYNAKRFSDGLGGASTRRKWGMILRATRGIEDIRTVLDIPCGTGRFTRQILDRGWRLVNGDISLPMLREARRLGEGREALLGGVRCDAERLPFPDASIDMVMSIRFLMHVPDDLKVRILREYARISRRWVLVDVRHQYCINTQVKRLRRALGAKRKTPPRRYSLGRLKRDIEASGLVIRRRIWLVPPFSEKLLVLCERTDRTGKQGS